MTDTRARRAARPATQKHVILFLAANPRGTTQLALDQEARSIRAELQRSGHRDRFDFVTRWAVEPLDLLREIRELRPTVVHFSGHGARVLGERRSEPGRDVVQATPPAAQHGLYLHDAAGGAQLVMAEAIARTIAAAGTAIKLVVLEACFTEPIAETLLRHVDNVVGVGGAIGDEAARSFSIGFYGGLGAYASIATAFEQGKAAISLVDATDAELPKLKVRPGCHAHDVVLAAVTPGHRVAIPCPYPGMRPYAADDADSFHGRDAEITELISRLRAGEREIYVIGPSGSGKSSLVAAGAVPRLAAGVAGLGSFVVRHVRPGDQPAMRLGEALEATPGQPWIAAERIAAVLAHRGARASVLIVIDQLEELFTLATSDERARFLHALRSLRSERRCAVILTLRADFFGLLMESPLWVEQRGQLSRIEVSPLRGDALREAIAAPARDVGVTVEPELIERLTADAASEPGILPLLQETLVQLWDARSERTLALADYEALGDSERSGLAVALARRADATLRRFTPEQTQIAHRILLRLVSFGDGRSDTRRQQPRTKLTAVGEDDAALAHVLQAMIDARLLTVDGRGSPAAGSAAGWQRGLIDAGGGEPRIDLAHEIMISAWPTLAGWLRSHRVDEQRRRQLEAAAARWVEYQRGVRGLLDPIELADAERWQHTESARALGHSAEVMELIAASKAEHARRLREARDQADKLEASERRSRQLLAQSYTESGRQLLVAGRAREAIPYFLAARETGDDGAPLRMMFWIATRSVPLISALQHQAAVVSAAFSPDGTHVVTASDDHTARIWHASTGTASTGPLEHQAEVTGAAFSPDGTRVVTASDDHTARVWDATTGEPLVAPLEHQAAVVRAVFSPDGTRVVTASCDRTARVWEAATGKPLMTLEHEAQLVGAAFSPDGLHVVTASSDRTARLWDAATGALLTHLHTRRAHADRVITTGDDTITRRWAVAIGTAITIPFEHQDPGTSTSISLHCSSGNRDDDPASGWDPTSEQPLTRPIEFRADPESAVFRLDGALVVTASGKSAQVWDPASERAVTRPFEHQAQVRSATLSPDGARVATTSRDKTARIWDAATGDPLTGPLKHPADVVRVAFSPDSARVVTVSDNAARVWNVATGKQVTGALEHQAAVVHAGFSPDGTRLITASQDKTARVWEIRPLFTNPLEHRGSVWSAAFSPDGTRVVTASSDRTARVWDAATGTPCTGPLKHKKTVRSAVFSPDGTRVVTASSDKTVRIWDAATGTLRTRPLEHPSEVWNAVFSPDGARVLTISYDETARIWDAASGQQITRPLEHLAELCGVAFSPDGTCVVTASRDKTARIWDAASGQPITRPLDHHAGVRLAVFSPDGTRVVTAVRDKTVRVWDSATGRPISRFLQHGGLVWSAAFSPDGTRVVTASIDKTARIWDAATGQPITSPLEHDDQVESAAFSPDGSRVVTASSDKTARIWDAATGKPIIRPLEHRDRVWTATFSPDGARVVTASADHTARIWDVRVDAGTLEEWEIAARRSPFVLDGIALKQRDPAPPDAAPDS